MNENHFTTSLIQQKTKKYGENSYKPPMTSAMTSCGDWLNSTPAEIESFGLSLLFHGLKDWSKKLRFRLFGICCQS